MNVVNKFSDKRQWLLFFALTCVIATVFVVNSAYPHPSDTGKYFYFAAAMMFVTLAVCLNWRLVHVGWHDLPVAAFVLLLIVGRLHSGVQGDMRFWLFLLLVPLYLAVRAASAAPHGLRILQSLFMAVVMAEALWGLLQLYGFLPSCHARFKVTGSLFNPGPFAGFVAVGMPVALHAVLSKDRSVIERGLGFAVLGAALLILPVTESRAAWIAAAAGCAIVATRLIKWQLPIPKALAATLAIVVTCVLLLGLYHFKKDSADGRLLIWQVSIDIVKSHPAFGVGFGRFAAVYGDAQAAFFASGKGSEAQAIVADSPEYPFNEYIRIAVENGLSGLILFLIMVSGIILTNRKNKQSQGAKASLLSFLVFAAFSYPFNVLPLTIVFVFLLGMCQSLVPVRASAIEQQTLVGLNSHRRVIYLLCLLCLIITIIYPIKILSRSSAYREWCALRFLYQQDTFSTVLPDYQALYPKLSYEPSFLFELGQCLSKTGAYTESNRIFNENLRFGSDPMVYNCMGNNFKFLGDIRAAEQAYIHASQIVPNRHYPLYLLMQLYAESGQCNKARQTAQALIAKPVKIKSTAIREMQQAARQIINQTNSHESETNN